jgi:hypothetical protein
MIRKATEAAQKAAKQVTDLSKHGYRSLDLNFSENAGSGY